MLRHNNYTGLDKIIQYHNWRLTAWAEQSDKLYSKN